MLLLYHGLRALTRPIRRRLNEWSLHYHWSNPLIRKILAILGVVAMDSIFVGITYTIGNLLAFTPLDNMVRFLPKPLYLFLPLSLSNF
ncbi:hypothetical protein [Suttonella ornithocola]|uniref:hypothetical protein n=1 Tax=Suttonella ornithocola TaxID=279832 RepID=UPI0009335594|nr:hypothetical protein [Suttonella ornithocola]